MKVDRTIRDRVREINAMPGFTVDRVERGKHFKLFLTTSSGKQLLNCSISPSDWRAWQNNLSILRRWSQPV